MPRAVRLGVAVVHRLEIGQRGVLGTGRGAAHDRRAALDRVDVRHGAVEMVADLADPVDDGLEDLHVDGLAVDQPESWPDTIGYTSAPELRDRGGLGKRVDEVALVVDRATGDGYAGPDVGAETVGARWAASTWLRAAAIDVRACGEVLLGELGLGQLQVRLRGVRLVLGLDQRPGQHGEDHPGGDHDEGQERR